MSFVKNDNQQLTVLDSTFNLTEREKRMLEKSWANTFADKVFPAIDENIFSVLYSYQIGILYGSKLHRWYQIC